MYAGGDCIPVQSFDNCRGVGLSKVFMLTHGKEVRRVSFWPAALKALSVMVFRRIGKVSFSVRSGYFLTFINVKNSI